MNCYHCVKRLSFPRLAISLIGADKKQFKKDFFEFCPECFEYLFGTSIVFSSQKSIAISCHVCQSQIIASLPYSYFMHVNKEPYPLSKRRVCGSCSIRELFPIITSLLIVQPFHEG